MVENSNNVKVVLKKKQISILVDFCIEESIEFGVKQQVFPGTDWEVELKIKDIKTAIIVGMFLRENRLEIEGLDQQRLKKAAGKKTDDKAETITKGESSTKKELSVKAQETEDSQSPTLL